MIYRFREHTPNIADSAMVADSATIRGNVRIGAGSVVLAGAVLTAEGGPVIVGEDCVVMEHAVLRGTPRHPLELDDRVLVGPHAHLTGCRVETGCFVATGASVFNGAVLEPGVEVRINAVVHVNSRVVAGTTIPIAWVAVGDPAQSFPPDDHEHIWKVQEGLDFPGTVFQGDRDTPTDELVRRYAEALRRQAEDEPSES